MKELLFALGYLVACKKLNRDNLAESIGTTRQNLISAFKGRRPLPVAQMPSLRQALGLDDSYRFVSDRVHGLIVNLGKNQEATQDILQDLLRRFMTWPLCNKWFLRGIGEGSRSGFAYVFEDSRGALLAVRNEDALLGTSLSHSPTVENNALKTENAMDTAVDMAGLFSRTDGSPEREFPLAAFDALFTEGMGMNAEDLRVALTSAATVWTWTRLREKAEQAGHSAESAARALGLTGGTSIE